MLRATLPFCLWFIVAGSLLLIAQSVGADRDIVGEWQITRTPQFGPLQYDILNLAVSGEIITGTYGSAKLEGHYRAGTMEATVQRGGNRVEKLRGSLRAGELGGDGAVGDSKYTWTGRRMPQPPADGPRTHRFVPTEFHNYFSSKIAPALRIFPGDTVKTNSVDAGGLDQNGRRRAAGGNPLTGPFYIEGAFPGDILVIKLKRVRLNRDTAHSGELIVASALEPWFFRSLKFPEKFESAWHLDHDAGVARLAKPTERLKNYTVPLAPMLGCIGVAPPQEMSFRTGWLGSWGGNMDYNQLTEGTTVYLPVYHPGALLFMGDGHAVQGDGELTGDALETSMEFSFTVEVLKGRSLSAPRAESATHRMASGIANSLSEALQQATTNLARWIADDFKLNANEVSLVLGTGIRYDIAEVVDPQVHIVAKIDKSLLARLQP